MIEILIEARVAEIMKKGLIGRSKIRIWHF